MHAHDWKIKTYIWIIFNFSKNITSIGPYHPLFYSTILYVKEKYLIIPYHFPMWVPPGYLLVSESNNKLLCPYLIDSDAAVFWSYYTRFKTKKAKICIHIGLLRPHFCLLHKIFDVTILAKPSFVFRSLKHHEILSWPPIPRDVWSNAIIWRNQNKKRTYPFFDFLKPMLLSISSLLIVV